MAAEAAGQATASAVKLWFAEAGDNGAFPLETVGWRFITHAAAAAGQTQADRTPTFTDTAEYQ